MLVRVSLQSARSLHTTPILFYVLHFVLAYAYIFPFFIPHDFIIIIIAGDVGRYNHRVTGISLLLQASHP